MTHDPSTHSLLCPSGVQGQSHWSGIRDKTLLKLKAFQHWDVEKSGDLLPF